MIKRILPVAVASALIFGTIGCQNGSSDFKNLKGVAYKIVKHGTGKKAEIGDIIEFQIVAKCDTYHLANSWIDQPGKAPMMPLQETQKPGEWQAVFPMLSAGDSAVVEISCDTLLKIMPPNNQQPLPPWLKKGSKVVLNLSLLSVKSKADFEKESKDKAAKQLTDDDKALQDYFAKNSLKPTKTASGLYYVVKKEGSGAAITAGQKVTMNYTGKLLNGTTFDSNEDSAFHHKTPFSFPVGMHQVISGWDEGVMLLKKGANATFYIPSPLAYGVNSPSPTIPANSILMFDVEVTDVAGDAKK